jgi:hypothetical protein
LKIDNKINGADPGQTTSTGSGDPNAMDILAVSTHLSDTDKAWMMRQGLCFRCGERGHLLRDCPLKGKPRNPDGATKGTGKGKEKEKVWIDALESLD